MQYIILDNLLDIRQYLDQTISITGFLYNTRVLKNFNFLIIRRNHITIQCIYHGTMPAITSESVVQIIGTAQLRNENNINDKEELGKYEIKVIEINILNLAKPLPFPISHASKNSAENRERYRFLDLRDQFGYTYLKTRIKAIKLTRQFFDNKDFLEIDTPIMTGPTENGANNYLVTSKKHKNKHYALAQSPQIYKQIIMCSDIEKYYQIAPCFRDEESRSNRIATEFTQVDVELKAQNMDDVIKIAVEYIQTLIQNLTTIPVKFEYFTYDEIIAKYSTDQVDIRVWDKYNIRIEEGRLEIDNLNNIFDELRDIFKDIKKQGDKIYISISSQEKNSLLMHLSTIYNKSNDCQYHYIAVVSRYPFFEQDEYGVQSFRHHPFSATYSYNNEVYAYQYDLILDAQEIAGGSIRECDPAKIRQYVSDPSLANFIEMYEYGNITHGGFALGLERFLSILLNTEIINFVPFFTRKNGSTTLVESPA